ncbi:SsgA family sporulation/cell division regulator [Streptomyces sp. NPDC006012]|uniref:SsgA family sporulation/cell division regulator n=1 Tax=Streptomyces sp. NPDC006012 TaxID=3364739 RepID=UPI00367464DA
MSVVEQYARARIVTPEDPLADAASVPVVLRYDPEADPDSVGVGLPGSLPGPRDWTFPRTLLEQGLRAPVEGGGIRVWPCGRVQAVVEFHSADGVSVVQFETKALLRFLRRTYTAAAPVAR